MLHYHHCNKQVTAKESESWKKQNFSQLLNDAINQPGIISKCYSTFHGYSLGNQLLAYSQCVARDIPRWPLSATFKKWKDLGRSVSKGQRPSRW